MCKLARNARKCVRNPAALQGLSPNLIGREFAFAAVMSRDNPEK
jgi:hypothetical protein